MNKSTAKTLFQLFIFTLCGLLFTGCGEDGDDNVNVNDNAPVAHAGSDSTINLGQTVQLDGNQSTDADNNLIDFTWIVIEQPGGSDAGLVGGNLINPTLTPDTEGSYTVQLTVNDGMFTDTDTVAITVNP